MKNYSVGLLVAAACMTTLIVLVIYSGRRPEDPHGPLMDASSQGPKSAFVLEGQIGEVEVLVKPLQIRPEHWRFANAALAKELGAEPSEWSFVEILVANRSEEAQTIDPATLSLTGAGGADIPVVGLRALGAGARLVPHLLARYSPNPEIALEPGHLRRAVVALPAEVAFESLEGGQFMGCQLSPSRAVSESLRQYLAADKPRGAMLAALLDPALRTELPGKDAMDGHAPAREEDR